MGSISLQIPQSGQLNSTEDPKIASDFTTIQTAINGNIDHTNLSSSAAIAQTQLAIGSWSALSLGANVGVQGSGYTPSARLYGDTVQLKGAMLTSGTINTGNIIATLPLSGMFPSAIVFVALRTSGSGTPVAQFEITTSGQIELLQAATISTGIIIAVDGVTFTIT